MNLIAMILWIIVAVLLFSKKIVVIKVTLIIRMVRRIQMSVVI